MHTQGRPSAHCKALQRTDSFVDEWWPLQWLGPNLHFQLSGLLPQTQVTALQYTALMTPTTEPICISQIVSHRCVALYWPPTHTVHCTTNTEIIQWNITMLHHLSVYAFTERAIHGRYISSNTRVLELELGELCKRITGQYPIWTDGLSDLTNQRTSLRKHKISIWSHSVRNLTLQKCLCNETAYT